MRKLEEIYADLNNLAKTLNDNTLYRLVNDIKDVILDEDDKKAAKDWVKSSGELRSHSKKAILIEVYRNKKYPGVMIHRSYSVQEELIKGWSISHDLSGYRLASGYPNMRRAVRTFIECAADVDWSRTADELTTDPKAHAAYNRLFTAG